MPRRATQLMTAGLALLLAVAVPEVLLRRATAALEEAACGDATGAQPPGDAFYRAVHRLDTLSLVPWTARRAAATATAAAMACLREYTAECGGLRDEAVEAARLVIEARLRGEGSGAEVAEQGTDWHTHLDATEVDAFCGAWATWRQWLSGEGLDAAAACPVCE